MVILPTARCLAISGIRWTFQQKPSIEAAVAMWKGRVVSPGDIFKDIFLHLARDTMDQTEKQSRTTGGNVEDNQQGISKGTDEGDWMDVGCELSSSLAQLFSDNGGKEDIQINSSPLIHLAALCAIRAYSTGIPDFQIAVNMEGCNFDHVILSYGKKEGDVNSGRTTRIYVVEKNGEDSNGLKAPSKVMDKGVCSHRLKKYFDLYRQIKRNGKTIIGGDELTVFIVCNNNGNGVEGGHLLFEEAILESTEKDDILSAEFMAFKEDFEVRRKLVTLLKDFCVDLPQEFANSLLENKKLAHQTIDTGLLESYWSALTQEVIDPELACFREDFLDGKKLSPSASHFRDHLWFRYKDGEEYAGASMSEADFRSFLSRKAVLLPLKMREKIWNKGKEASPEAMARYFMNLIARNPNSKVVKLDGGDNWVQMIMNKLSRYFSVTLGSRYVLRQEFVNGESLNEDLMAFRNHLKDDLEGLGVTLDTLQEYTFQLEGSSFSTGAGELLEQEVLEFLGKLRLCLGDPIYDDIQKSVKDEIAKCLHLFVAREATDKFLGLVSGAVKGGVLITESVIREFLDKRKWFRSILSMFMQIYPDLEFEETETDIMKKCFCRAIWTDTQDLDCCSNKNRKESILSSCLPQLLYCKRLHSDYNYQCMVIHLGPDAKKTREMKMKLAYHATLLGEHELALELTEGEVDVEYDQISARLSKGFRHVRGRALLGLGQDEECVDHFVLSCVSRTNPVIEVNKLTFRATINIVYDLVFRKKYQVAKNILANLLNKLHPKDDRNSSSDNKRCAFNPELEDAKDFRKEFDARTGYTHQLAYAIVDWFYSNGGSKKEVLEILRIIYQFFKSFLGNEEFPTLEVRFLFAITYCKQAKGLGQKKGLTYLLELHTTLCKFISEGSSYIQRLLHRLIIEILIVGGNTVGLEVMRKTYYCAVKELKFGHPITQTFLKVIECFVGTCPFFLDDITPLLGLPGATTTSRSTKEKPEK